ncbi:MAG: hypothetical protein KDB23_27165, partial [Planctomycetales bacterium]|nr:hypothetical protein [Planctomycetales bacterium]
RSLNGDLNDDGKVNEFDIDLLCRAIHAGAESGDLNGDGEVNEKDMDYLVHDILHTVYGDANLDGVFNSTDLIQIFRYGQYEDDIPNNSGWAQGDFDCDGDFTTGDLVKAMQSGAYSPTSLPAPARSADLLGAVLDSIDDDDLDDWFGLN